MRVSLGHIGHDQISMAAQVVHGGDHIRPQTAVQPAAVPQHGVHDLEGAGPQRKGLLHQLCLRGISQIT